MSPGYRRTLHSLTRSLLRSLGAHPECFQGFPGLKPVRPRETIVPDEEFEAVYAIAGPALQLALLLAREAGLRHATIMHLSMENVDLQNNLVHGRAKAYASYSVPLTARLRFKLIYACAGASDAKEPLLNQWNRQRKPMHYNSLTCALARARKLAAVKTSWGLHDLRRTGARKLYERTKDIRKVQRFLGHAALAQSFWYIGNAGIPLSAADLETPTTNQTESEAKIA